VVDIVPYAVNTITTKTQLTLGADALRGVQVAIGDRLWIVTNPDRPGTLVLIPDAIMAEIFEKGWRAVG
jgi:hypothetical protein